MSTIDTPTFHHGAYGRHLGVNEEVAKVVRLEPRIKNPFPYVSPESTLDSSLGLTTLPDLGNLIYGCCVPVSLAYAWAIYLWLAGIVPVGVWDPAYLPTMDQLLTAYFVYEGSPNPTDYAWSQQNGYDQGCDPGDFFLWMTKNKIGPMGPILGGFAVLPGLGEGQIYQGAIQTYKVLIDDIVVFVEMLTEFDNDQPWSVTSGTVDGGHQTANVMRNPTDGGTATWCKVKQLFTWPNRRATIEQTWVFWPDFPSVPNDYFDQALLISDIEALAGTLGISEGVGRREHVLKTKDRPSNAGLSVGSLVTQIAEDAAKIVEDVAAGNVAGAVEQAIEDIEEIVKEEEAKPAAPKVEAGSTPSAAGGATGGGPAGGLDPPAPFTDEPPSATAGGSATESSLVDRIREIVERIGGEAEDELDAIFADLDPGAKLDVHELLELLLKVPAFAEAWAEAQKVEGEVEKILHDVEGKPANPNEAQQRLAAGGVPVDEKGRPIGVPFERD